MQVTIEVASACLSTVHHVRYKQPQESIGRDFTIEWGCYINSVKGIRTNASVSGLLCIVCFSASFWIKWILVHFFIKTYYLVGMRKQGTKNARKCAFFKTVTDRKSIVHIDHGLTYTLSIVHDALFKLHVFLNRVFKSITTQMCSRRSTDTMQEFHA